MKQTPLHVGMYRKYLDIACVILTFHIVCTTNTHKRCSIWKNNYTTSINGNVNGCVFEHISINNNITGLRIYL